MKQLLIEVIKNWWNNPLPLIKPREVQLKTYFDPTVRKILSVVGFRRVGKTFALLDFAKEYGQQQCVYINFEDERIPKKTEMLTTLIEVLTELRGSEPLVLLMDEIQEIPNWSMWARRVNETTKHRLILSGSSSKLSSGEIPTELRGQTITVPMFPLSWREFLDFKDIKEENLPRAQKLYWLREYLQFGGMPEIVLAEAGLRPLILSDYLSSFVQRDIIERHNLRNTEALADLLRLLPNTHSYTYSKLANSLKSLGHAVGKATVIRYIRWLEEAFFVSGLEVFSANMKRRIQTVKKAYLIDNYFSTQFSSSLSANTGHLMEQAVFHKLWRWGAWDKRYELAYWRDYAGNEVDFVVVKNGVVDELMQVTFAESAHEIAGRETKALVKAAKALKVSRGTVITWDVEEVMSVKDVTLSYIPLWKWLNE